MKNIYLGLDLGSKSLGLAISRSGIIANAYDTFYFQEDNYEAALEKMLEIIKREQITILVIGLPRHMNNDLGIRGELSYKFKAMLLKKVNIEVVLWDERTSTQAAIKTLIAGGQSRKKQKSKKDEVAAIIILQNYLDYKEKRK